MLASAQGQSSERPTVSISLATLSELGSVAGVHLSTFEGFFLESLGPRFLEELYRGFILDPSGLCLVAVEDSRVVGFVAGTTQPEQFFRRLLRRRWYAFVLAGATSFALHPIRVGKKFLSALRYRGEKPVGIPSAALLSSIGVTPSRKGIGIGKLLITAFCERVKASGTPIIVLSTDRDKNDAVNQFYLTNGFRLHSSYLKERSRWMNLYMHS